MEHFKEKHYKNADGGFVVPLPFYSRAVLLGESRNGSEVQKFEQSLCCKGQFERFAHCVKEYFALGHAEPVSTVALKKSCNEVYYMPVHAVRIELSTTTKLRVVFNA